MTCEKLYEALSEVKLRHSAQIIEAHLEEARHNNVSHTTFLQKLLEEEIAFRKQNRIKERIRASGIKIKKTLTDYDFSHPEKINQKLVCSLFDLSFISEKKNIIIIGKPGLGKSHIASAICFEACLNEYKCLFSPAVDLITQLNASLSDNSFIRKMKRLARLDLLIIDELGYLPVDKQGANLLFQIITNRYEKASVIITTNRPFKEWGTVFNGDQVLAGAMIDRLIHHCEIIKIEGQSYRVGRK